MKTGSEEIRLCPIVVEKSDVILVKPSAPTPIITSLSLSTIDNDPYIETLAKTIYVYSQNDAVTEPAYVVVEKALSKALVYYYPLAGKLRRRKEDMRLELRCSEGDGVPLIRARAACTLASVNHLEGSGADVEELVPRHEGGGGWYEPLALQVTSFSCGGMTIGMALSHSVCDGFGASQFFRAVSELASGLTRPSVIPLWHRHLLTFRPQELDEDSNSKLHDFPSMSSVATSPYTPADDMVREIVNVTSEDITRLKTMIANEEDTTVINPTTLEVLGAHVWRARCRALKLNPQGITLFGLAVGIRHLVKPPLPEGYYGNAFVKSHVGMRAAELAESPLSRIVKLIREVKKRAMEERYLMEQLRETERMLKKKAEFEGGNGAFMLLTDWRQLGLLQEVDFGWKESVNIIPLVPLNLPDMCIFLPPSKMVPSMKDGVRVLVTLPRAAMANFRQEIICM